MRGSALSDVVDASGQFEIFVCQTSHIVRPNTDLQLRVARQHFGVVVLCLSQLGNLVELRHRCVKAG